MTGAPTWFQPFVPSADLHDVLECRYLASSAGRHELLPDGSMDLVWTGRLGAVLCGPDTRGWSFDMPAGHDMAGIRFRPGAAAGVFRLEATDLVDQRVALADVLGGRTDRQLADRLATAPTGEARMDALEDVVRRLVTDPDPTVAVAAHLTSTPCTDVGRLAELAGLSPRQLRRRFDRTVGYGPAFLARIARLQRFAKGAARRPRRGLAELAADAGYVDQSHLAKDVRTFADRTPSELVATLGSSSLAVDPLVSPDGRLVQDRTSRSGARWAA